MSVTIKRIIYMRLRESYHKKFNERYNKRRDYAKCRIKVYSIISSHIENHSMFKGKEIHAEMSFRALIFSLLPKIRR